jgi:hypothetical protein
VACVMRDWVLVETVRREDRKAGSPRTLVLKDVQHPSIHSGGAFTGGRLLPSLTRVRSIEKFM